MKNIAVISVLALSLAGCATSGGNSGAPTTTQINDTVKKIQDYTRTFCRFVPTVQTIVSIFSAGAGSAIGVANDICAAVTTAPLADGGPRAAKVKGVTIQGRFVR